MHTDENALEPLELAQKAFRHALEWAGSQRKLARRLGLSQQRISAILVALDEGDPKAVPAEHAVTIHRASEGLINKDDLRPDLFP